MLNLRMKYDGSRGELCICFSLVSSSGRLLYGHLFRSLFFKIRKVARFFSISHDVSITYFSPSMACFFAPVPFFI